MWQTVRVLICWKGEFVREETSDGLERTMASNHFGHFLLTNLLLPHLKRTAEAALASGSPAPRIVVVSSSGHRVIYPFQTTPRLDIDENSDDLNVRVSVASVRTAHSALTDVQYL